MKTWAERIAELERLGWSLSDLAAHCGIAYSSLSDLKAGRSKEPRGMAAVKLHSLEGKSSPPKRPKEAA